MLCISYCFGLCRKNSNFRNNMLPDYPHKIFNDKRACYCLLMKALTMYGVVNVAQ
jgi:hypothetical protein